MDFVETDELSFVTHAVAMLGVENERPDLHPGGVWRRPGNPHITLTWGFRSATEPPTIVLNNRPDLLNGSMPLPREMDLRLCAWRAAWRARKNIPGLDQIDFRATVLITAILGIEEEPDDDDEP